MRSNSYSINELDDDFDDDDIMDLHDCSFTTAMNSANE